MWLEDVIIGITTLYTHVYLVLHICTEADCVLGESRQSDYVDKGQAHHGSIGCWGEKWRNTEITSYARQHLSSSF